jgi:hypothetical protein
MSVLCDLAFHWLSHGDAIMIDLKVVAFPRLPAREHLVSARSSQAKADAMVMPTTMVPGRCRSPRRSRAHGTHILDRPAWRKATARRDERAVPESLDQVFLNRLPPRIGRRHGEEEQTATCRTHHPAGIGRPGEVRRHMPKLATRWFSWWRPITPIPRGSASRQHGARR